MKGTLLVVATTVFTLGVAQAQVRTPTDIELKAAYCVKVTEDSIAHFRSQSKTAQAAEAPQVLVGWISDAEDRLNRLQLYLAPRMPELEQTAMAAAMKRAEADGASSNSIALTLRDQCAAKCQPNASIHADPVLKCLDECFGQNPVLARIYSCRNINWLPF